MKTKKKDRPQENMRNFVPGIYANENGDRLKVTGFGFLNGWPFVSWFWTNIPGSDRGGGTALDGFEKFMEDFNLVKECDLHCYKKK